MPVSIVKVPLDTSDFDKFVEKYKKFEGSLKKLPGAWGETGNAVKTTGITFTEMTAALLAQFELTRETLKTQEKQEKTVRNTARTMKDMTRDGKEFARSMVSATSSIIKWAGLAGGLIGGAGLFGIDKLAQGAAGYRRQGLGIGASPAEQRAFQVNYGKYVDPDSFLSNINNVTNDLSKQWGLGGDAAAMARQGKDSAQIAVALLPKMVDQFIAAGGLKGRGVQAMQAYGLDRFGSLQDFERAARSRGELGASATAYGRDVNDLGVSDDTSKKWQDFTIQLTRAGNKIETVFINDLVPLEPGLERLSDAVVHALDAFLKNPNLGKWLSDVSDGMEGLAGWLGKLGFSSPGGGPSSGPGAGSLPSADLQDSKNHPDYSKGDLYDRTVNRLMFGGGAAGVYAPNDALLNGIKAAEGSSSNSVSPAGARGVYQFMPGTAKDYGLTDPTDEAASRGAAKRYLRDLIREFGGDQNKAVAAYNWGPGNVQKDIDTYGSDWRNHLPAETSKYLQKVEITVHNQTGGSAVIAANQVAQ